MNPTQHNTQKSVEEWEEQTCNTVDAIFQSHLLNENPQRREMFLDTIRPLLTTAHQRGVEEEKKRIKKVVERLREMKKDIEAPVYDKAQVEKYSYNIALQDQTTHLQEVIDGLNHPNKEDI